MVEVLSYFEPLVMPKSTQILLKTIYIATSVSVKFYKGYKNKL